MPDILTLLEVLADLHAQQAAIRAAQAVALPVRLRERLAEVEARFAPELAAVARELALVERQVKDAVLAHGQSVKGARLQAVYIHGRPSWNDDLLAGYAVAGHTEIWAFRTLGKPSVTLRQVAEQEATA